MKQPDDGNEEPAGWALVPRVPGSGPRRVLLVAAVVCLCAIVTGVALAAFSSPSGQAGHVAGASNSPSAATAQAAQPVPAVASGRGTAGPGITSNGIAKTALRWPSALKGQILRWKEGPGGAAWSAVTAQLGNVTQTGGVRLYPALRPACVSLSSSVGTAQGAPPIPDGAMQRLYARTLARLSSTAADCRTSISVHPQGDEGMRIVVDKALLNRSLAEFAAESKELYAATAEIRALRP